MCAVFRSRYKKVEATVKEIERDLRTLEIVEYIKSK